MSSNSEPVRCQSSADGAQCILVNGHGGECVSDTRKV